MHLNFLNAYSEECSKFGPRLASCIFPDCNHKLKKRDIFISPKCRNLDDMLSKTTV